MNMKWLKQPSTWRGVFLFIGLFGWSLRPELQDAIIAAIVSALALIEVIRDEHAPTPIEIQLPPIDLVGVADRADAVADRRAAAGSRMQQPVRAVRNTVEAADGDGADFPGWGS